MKLTRDKEIEEIYGKSIWEMTVGELIENDLVSDWVNLANAYAEYDNEGDE